MLGIHFTPGVGLLSYKAKTNALDNNGKNYAALYKEVFNSFSSTRGNEIAILKKIKNGLDNTYETNAEGGKQTILTQNVALGISYRFKKRFEIGIERKFMYVKTDLLDEQRWQEFSYGDAVMTRDFDGILSNYVTFAYHF